METKNVHQDGFAHWKLIQKKQIIVSHFCGELIPGGFFFFFKGG